MKGCEATIPASEKVHFSRALEGLVKLYDAWGQKAKAAKWRKKRDEAKSSHKKPAK
jgi:hypothetical protein